MLKNKLAQDLKNALRNRDSFRVSVLRMLLSAIANREIEILKKETGLADEEVADILRQEFKKRKDASEEFNKGGRHDLAEKELKESEIIAPYLPQEMSDEEIVRIVRESVREAGATGPDDFGRVMKLVMAVLKGKASGDRVASAVKKSLSGVSD